MSKKAYYIAGAVVILLGIIGYLALKSPAKAATGEAITSDVKRGDVVKMITATGTIQQPQTYNLTLKGQGPKLTKVNVGVGDKVKAGDILAQGDLTTLNLQLAQAQSNLNTAKSNMDKVKAGPTTTEIASLNASLAKAQSDYVKMQDSYNSNPTVVNKAAMDASKASLDSAQAALDAKKATPTTYDLQSVQAAFDQAQQNYNIAKQNVADATLVAPIDGIIVAQNGKAGEIVGTLPVVTLQSTSNDMQIQSSIDETDIGFVKLGQETVITLDPYPGKKFKGKVVLVSPIAKTLSNVTYFDIIISVTNENDMLKTGMNANIGIQVADVKNVIAVSSEAVKEDSDGKYVQIIDPSSTRPTKANVEIGIDNGALAEVKSGLQVGDKVLLGYKVTSSQQTTKSSSPFGGGGKGMRG